MSKRCKHEGRKKKIAKKSPRNTPRRLTAATKDGIGYSLLPELRFLFSIGVGIGIGIGIETPKQRKRGSTQSRKDAKVGYQLLVIRSGLHELRVLRDEIPVWRR